MRALLLAAGLGTRLKPLTNYLPKCMVPIHGRPLIDYWIETLVDSGITEILINTHYLAHIVVDYIKCSSWAKNVCLVHEEKLLGTGGTILANRDFFQKEAFLVAHADNLTTFDPATFIKCHMERPSTVQLSMLVFETPDPKSCGIVELDESRLITAFHEKVTNPPGNLANGAVYILENSVLNFIENLGKTNIDFSTEVIPHFIGHIQTHRNFAYHRDIGTIESWVESHTDFTSVPASEHNAKVWAAIQKTVNDDKLVIISQLLARHAN